MAKFSLILFFLTSIFIFGQSKKSLQIKNGKLKSDNTVVVIGNDTDDERATFTGGDSAFRKIILDNLESKKYINDKKSECTILCTITNKGEMTDLITLSEDHIFANDVSNSIHKLNPKWKPAKIDGKFVKSRLKISVFYE